MKGKCLIFSAPSGSGKSTIVQWLTKEHPELNLVFSISATSRPPRGTEQHGVEYFFLTPEEFKAKIEADEFLEYEEVYAGSFYAFSIWIGLGVLAIYELLAYLFRRDSRSVAFAATAIALSDTTLFISTSHTKLRSWRFHGPSFLPLLERLRLLRINLAPFVAILFQSEFRLLNVRV